MNVPALLPVRRVLLLLHLFPLQMMNLLCELRRPLRKWVAIRVTALPSGSHLHIRRRVVKASQTQVAGWTSQRRLIPPPPPPLPPLPPPPHPSSSSSPPPPPPHHHHHHNHHHHHPLIFTPQPGAIFYACLFNSALIQPWHAWPDTSSAVRQKPARTPVWFSWLFDSRSKHLTASPPAGRPSLNAFWLFNLFPLSATWTPVCLKQRLVLIRSCVDYVCSLGLPELGLLFPRWGLCGCIQTLLFPRHNQRLKQSSTSKPFLPASFSSSQLNCQFQTRQLVVKNLSLHHHFRAGHGGKQMDVKWVQFSVMALNLGVRSV